MKHGLLANGCSAALADWLLERRGDFVGPGPLFSLQLRYGAFWFERLLNTQDRLEPLAVPAPDTAFILGFWRSGTTLLHNLLYAGWACRTPLSWECFRPATFRLQPPPRSDAVGLRPMDGGIVHSLGPQEDEFAALLLGEPSLYRGFLDPNRLQAVADTVLAGTDCRRWGRFVGSLAAEPGDVTLLKSPNHIFRLEAIARLFPSHREVWIGRTFDRVLRSNLGMWSAMAQRHAVTRFTPEVIDRFVARVAQAYAVVLHHVLDRPAGSLLWIDFDDLVSRPGEVADRVAGYLCLAPRPAAERSAIPADAVVHATTLARTGPPIGDGLARIASEIDGLQKAASLRFGRG